MSHRQTGFLDERRAAYGVYESYKPGQDSRDRDHGSRDRSRDIDRERGPLHRDLHRRDSDRRSSESRQYDRRDSRDSRNSRDEQDFGRSRDKAKDDDTQSAGLKVNTNIPTGPRATVSSSRASPSTLRTAPPLVRPAAGGPTTDRSTPSDSAATTPIATAPPAKRQDTKYMAAYGTVSNFADAVMRRSAVYQQKKKKMREMEKRDSDAKQYVGKFDDFPSMLEATNLAKERDMKEYAKIKDEMAKIDVVFLQQVDNLAAALLTPSECHATPAAAGPDLSSFEAKFALFQKEFDEAKGKIRELEMGRQKADVKIKELEMGHQKADDKIKNLEQEREDSNSRIKDLETANSAVDQVILAIRSNHTALEQKHVQLASEIAQLRGQTEDRTNNLVGRVTSTESKVVLLEQSKVSSETLISATEELRDSQNQAVADLKRRLDVSNTNEKHRHTLAANLDGLKDKVSKLEAGLLTTQSLLEQVEQDKLDDVYNLWDTLQIPEKVVRHNDEIERLLKEIKVLKESNTCEGQHSDHTLGAEMTALKGAVQNNATNIAALLQKFNAINANVQSTTSDWGEAIGNMIDEMGLRVQKLEQLPANHGASRTPAATPQLDARGSPVIGDARLEARVKAIEDQNLLERSEQIQLGLNTAEQSLKQSVEWVNKNTMAFDAGLQDIKRNLQDIGATHEETKRQLEAQQLALNTLDTQINNIFTKQLAEAIVKQMDTFTTRLNPRMDVLELKLKAYESNAKQLDENFAAFRRELKAANVYHQQKRSASPSNRHASEDGGKKRRLDINGRASPRPAQPLRNGSSTHY